MARPDRLIYLALGGAGEIGMNMYLYGYGPAGAERFILVDMGVSFPTMETTPGRRADHGRPGLDPGPRRPARGDLHHPRPRGPRRRARPALAPAAGAGLCPPLHRARSPRRRWSAPGRTPTAVRQVAPWPHVVQAGPFSVGFLPISHSIPESSALVIDTPAGRILHSGRLQGRPDAAGRRAVRPGGVPRHRRRGGEGAGLQLHQRLLAAPRPLGGVADRADRRADAPRPRAWSSPPPSPRTWRG